MFNPMFLHAISASSHIVLLVSLSLFWIWKRFDDQKVVRTSRRRILFYKQTLIIWFCLGLAIFNLVFSFLSYFYEGIVVQGDFVSRSLSWGLVFAYLYIQVLLTDHGSNSFPVLLRIWWCFFFVLSSFLMVVDIVSYKKNGLVSKRTWISDIVSCIVGLFIFYAGVFGKLEHEERNVEGEEPLLNDNVSGVSEKSEIPIVSPFTNASFFGVLSFSWLDPLLAIGYKKSINFEDVPELDGEDSVYCIYPVFKSKLDSYSNNDELEITSYILVKALLFATWRQILLSAIFPLLYVSASYVGPFLIETFVKYLNGRREFKNEGYVLVSAFFIAKIIEGLSQRHRFFRAQQIGMRVRAALVSIIYQKGLILSSQSRQAHTSGEIINFMSVDAERIGDFTWYMHDLWMVLIQITLALLILYKNLGVAAVATLVATVALMLTNIPLGKYQEKFQKKLMGSKDERMKTTSEILRNMRILKLQGWEMKFLSKVFNFRKNEEGWLKKYVYTGAVTAFVFNLAPILVSVITFSAAVLMGVPLESGKVLSALATFRVLAEPIYNLPDSISMIIQTKVSFDRIASFLRLSELQPDVINTTPSHMHASDVAIEINNGNFSWDVTSSYPTLKDINLQVNRSMKVAVCGTVGSGKSSLLSCILGEVPKLTGTITVNGSKAYVAQSPWIQSMKIEDNILFGKEMDKKRYDRVLEACTLKKDLETLSFGDQTVIGERGINLSGGQKQRIQIARALYQDADIYLFDDPFSAVDAHTGTHLYKECLLGLLSSKTVIYVTHQVEFLPSADLILVMRDGKITQAGKFDDILSSGTDFMELVGAHRKALETLGSIDDTTQNSVDLNTRDVSNTLEKEEASATNEIVSQCNAQIIKEEEREKGRVGFQVYWKYLTTAYKGGLVVLIMSVSIVLQMLNVGSNYWMALATPVSKDAKSPVTTSMLLNVYVALALCSSFCVLTRALLRATAAYKTATLLFKKMHLCIFRAPMSFFDATPSGRILSRASTDQSAVDMSIASLYSHVAYSLIQLIAVVVVMSQVAWQIFVLFVPVVLICIWYQQYYVPTARELSRLLGVYKAPIIQHFAESISGSTTIRSFDQDSRFMDHNLKLNDNYSRPLFYSSAAMEWLCFRLDIFSAVTFAFSLFFLVSMPDGIINPGIAGLAVIYGLTLDDLQAWFILSLCNLENKIVCVERILQYSDIPSEPSLTSIEGKKPGVNWPSHGKIDFYGLQVRYAPHMPVVLRGISCTLSGGKKTGIVGRTGSGKSTLIQALFRIVDPTTGYILIDSIDICTIGLHDLRSKLSIIPQDPTLFEGTVRSNLDPLEQYTDEDIWEALDMCQLGDEVRKKEEKLDCPVNENGENWSMGQRQLVCLGRVLLKKSKVLVLDEATASVDTATDNLIQLTLRQHFFDCTVITIAHRITSVINSDMVLLLDQGLIKEYDTPSKLLDNKFSSFSKLVAEYTLRSNSSYGN